MPDLPNVPVTAQPAVSTEPAPVMAEPAESVPAVEPQGTPPEPTPAVEPQEPLAAEPSEDPEAQPGTTGDPGSEPAGEQKVDLQEHIKLRKRAQEAERHAAFLEGRLQSTQPQTPSTPETKAGPPKFTPLEEFDGPYDDWQTAKTKHEIKWELEQQQKAAQIDIVEKKYYERCDTAAQTIPDLQETIDTARLPRYDNAVVTAVKKSDLGPQMIYYLAKNPTEAARLAQMEPELAIMEIGSLRGKVETMFQQKTKKTTSAPPPINPGNAAGVTVTTDLADKDMTDYAKARDAESFAKVGGRLIRR